MKITSTFSNVLIIYLVKATSENATALATNNKGCLLPQIFFIFYKLRSLITSSIIMTILITCLFAIYRIIND